MKIERKVKNARRDKRQRKSRMTKRTKQKQSFKYYSQSDEETQPSHDNKSFTNEQHDKENLESTISKITSNFRLNNLFSIKILLAASLAIAVLVVSLNISPILKYALQDQNSTIYPILKKYADELRGISTRLMVVTRRINMLSILSEENELRNVNRINNLVLQINEMWFTTKKYLNFIGIETIAHTELEKEIDANSKVNEQGLIRETKTEEIFPNEEITLTNVLKLDSIVQSLNTEIDNINNEITFLEDNVFASIKASHVYSRLLERSRNANGNYYADSTLPQGTEKIKILNKPPVIQQAMVPQKSIATPNVIATKKINEPLKIKTSEPKKPVIALVNKPAVTTSSVAPVIINKKAPKSKKVKQTKPIAVAKVKKKQPINKIVGAFTVKDTKIKKNRKSQNNKLTNSDNTEVTTDTTEEAYENTFLLDDTILGFITTYDDYGNVEDEKAKDKNSPQPEEDDDYTGG
ncbi:MAG: hypothetical protein ACC657_02800 [Thiohalomonadales bacterium]